MIIKDANRIYDTAKFSKYEVGAKSESGIYPVKAYYPDSENFEVLYANTNISHCYSYLEALGNLLEAKNVNF